MHWHTLEAAPIPFALSAPALAAAWILIQLAAADLDAAQPVAGGGDIAHLAPPLA